MSYASYVSKFLRANGLRDALDNKLIGVQQDRTDPSTTAYVCLGKVSGLDERKAVFSYAQTVLKNNGFSIPMVGANAFKVMGAALPATSVQKPLPGFNSWLSTFVDEKGLDLEHRFDVKGPKWGWNSIPLGVVVETCKIATPQEQAQIKNTLVKIDVLNGDPMHFFKHLAQGMAK